MGNVGWYYLVIGAVLGGIFIVIENLFKNPQSKKILGFTSVFFVMVMAILEATRQTFSNLIYYIFFSTPTLEQTYTWAGPLFVISLVLAIVFLVWQKFSQKDVFSISKSENLPYIVAASLVIILFFYPTIFRQAPINWSFMVFSRNGVNSVGTSSLGLNFDGNLMEFIKTDIPSKSTILANAPTSKNLSVLTDNYMVYNQGTAWAEKFKKVFGGEFDSSVVKEIINDPKYKIDYIIVSPVDQINSDIFNESRYKLIYNQEVSIYQANK
ncbi:MAG: hypothetical protein HW405_745 [Candidatus Berkelbacteria bacterium]|nr:hypothetical protein [Candidatus Berkelbacteria bacterium]